MDEEEFSYKTLRKIQQAEKQSSTITKIPKTLYDDFQSFRTNLQKQLEKETKQNRQMLLADEIQNIEKIITNIYEQREKKIMMAAMTQIRGGSPTVKYLLDPELNLFNSFQKLLQSTRTLVLSEDKKPEASDNSDETAEKHHEESNTVPYEEEKPEASDNSDETTENHYEEKNTTPHEEKKNIEKPLIGNDHMVLQVVKDMPMFVGTDAKKYLIKEEDILSVPKKMGEMLIKRHIAEKINIQN